MTVQEFVNIDKDLQTVQDISDVNIIILIYLFIKNVLSSSSFEGLLEDPI
jgi:cytochrome c oxidase assembly protein Cox11